MSQLEDRLDEMREQLELWVLRAAAETVDPSGLRGLLHLGAASEEVGDAAQQLVWLVEADEEMHPVLAVALGETDDVVVQYPVARGQPRSTARWSAGTQVGDDTGFHLLAIRRGGRYFYRPRGRITLVAGDEVLASGPRDGRAALAEQCGFRLVEDDDTGAVELVPSERRAASRGGCGRERDPDGTTTDERGADVAERGHLELPRLQHRLGRERARDRARRCGRRSRCC